MPAVIGRTKRRLSSSKLWKQISFHSLYIKFNNILKCDGLKVWIRLVCSLGPIQTTSAYVWCSWLQQHRDRKCPISLQKLNCMLHVAGDSQHSVNKPIVEFSKLYLGTEVYPYPGINSLYRKFIYHGDNIVHTLLQLKCFINRGLSIGRIKQNFHRVDTWSFFNDNDMWCNFTSGDALAIVIDYLPMSGVENIFFSCSKVDFWKCSCANTYCDHNRVNKILFQNIFHGNFDSVLQFAICLEFFLCPIKIYLE